MGACTVAVATILYRFNAFWSQDKYPACYVAACLHLLRTQGWAVTTSCGACCETDLTLCCSDEGPSCCDPQSCQISSLSQSTTIGTHDASSKTSGLTAMVGGGLTQSDWLCCGPPAFYECSAVSSWAVWEPVTRYQAYISQTFIQPGRQSIAFAASQTCSSASLAKRGVSMRVSGEAIVPSVAFQQPFWHQWASHLGI